MSKRLTVVFFLAATIFSALSANALAQQGGLNIEISPLPIQLNVKPGSSTSSDLRVRNASTVDETLKASLKTFSAEGPDGHIVLHDPGPNNDYLKWVSFDRNVFTIPPGQWETIHMTVDVPKTAAFGYYYAVQFELAQQPKAQPGTAKLKGAVAVFVLLNAQAPGASRQIQVTTFESEHSTYEFLPINFAIQVRNAGNVHTAPHGNIFIKRGGKQVAALTVNDAEGMVLPKSNRVFTASWNDGFPNYVNKTNGSGEPIKDAKGNPKKELKWDFSKISHLRFGHYTANLLLVYNDGTRDVPIGGSLSFWVIPWRLLAVVIIVLLLAAVGLWSSINRVRKVVKKVSNKKSKNEKS